MKTVLLCACTMLTSAMAAGLAQGQTAPAPPASRFATETSKGGIQEVIVTAEKRSQSLQTVPVAVSAFTSQTRDLIGILSTKDLTNYTPGLSYSQSGDRIFLRGVGRFTNNLGSDPGIANYADGVYTTFAVASGEDPLFVDRVEVLRGPQGTLYGRNSIGGAINVISKRPLDHFQGEVRVTEGSYGRNTYLGYITGPLPYLNDVPNLSGWAYRLSYDHQNQDHGYYHNLSGLKSEGSVQDETFIDAQVKGKIGEHFDLWAKWNRQAYDNANVPSLVHNGYSDAAPDPAAFPAGSLTPSAAFAYTSAAINPVFYGPPIYNAAIATGDHRAFNTNKAFGNTVSHNNNFNIEAIYHLPGVDIKYLGGWLKYHYDQLYDYDDHNVLSYQLPCSTPGCTPATVYPDNRGYYAEHKEFYSHEVNFSSTSPGPVQWLTGLYYYHEEYSQPFYIAQPQQAVLAAPLNLPAFTAAAANPNRYIFYNDIYGINSSEAVFGQVDWKFAPTFKLTAGARYSNDDKRLFEEQRLIYWNPVATGAATPAFDVTTATDPSAAGPGGTEPGVVKGSFFRNTATGISSRLLKDSFSATTGTIGLEWQPDHSTLGYVKFSKGFKSGGFAPGPTGTLQALPETGSESLNAYEGGFKETWNKTLQTNIAVFYYDYKGAQVPVTIVPPIGTVAVSTSQFINLPKVRNVGFEAETIWSPIPHLNVLFNYSYVSAEIRKACCYVDPVDPSGLQPGVKVGNTSTTIDAVTHLPTVGEDLSGQQMPASPKNKVSLNANYTWMFDQGDLVGSISYLWKDSSYSSIFNRSYNYVPSQEQVDARITWTGRGNKYSVVLFGQNLFNNEIIDAQSGTRQSTGVIAHGYTLLAPRTYGVQLEYRF